jgi:formylglycine-generating enzyme required for sulfatase activity
MRILFSIILINLFLITTPAHAAKLVKANKASKERLVLMPLRVADEDRNLVGNMEAALVQGLQQKYEVFSGEQVAQKAKAIFLKESKVATKKECDETRCMQDIAEAFQAELIATANVSKRPDGYFLALSVQNIFDNKVVYSNSVACKSCDAYQVVDKLKELSGTAVQATSTQTDNSEIPARSIVLPTVPAAPRISGKANDAETQVWAEVVASNKIDDYKLYLDSYPQGKYFKQASEQKKKLEAYAKASTDAVVARESESAWKTAQQSNSVASYTQYLNQFPNGSYAALAKIRKNKVVIAEEAALGAVIAPVMVRIPGKSYEMGKYEVTQGEWKAVMGSNPSHFTNCGDICPVEKVSWDDIQTYIQKLNAKSGRQYRLPTEDEWVYACYGGTKTEYCGSNDIDAVAWYDKNSNDTTHPGGQKQANGYGLYDMSGNVWEWQSDCYEGDCAKRVLRGGSWNNFPQYVRADNRDWYVATDRNDLGGFRLARTLP